MKNLFLLVLLFTAPSLASLLTEIEIEQKNSQLQFKVSFSTETSDTLQLTSEAQITQWGNLKLSKNAKGLHQIQLTKGQKGFLHYTISLDLSKPYFLSGLRVWHPVNPQFPEGDKFQFQTKLNPEFELIHSATGFPQGDLAYVFGKFKKYQSVDKRLLVYLSQDEPALAETLLQNLKKYLDHYENSIGTYPYDVFQVVEAPSEIGYAFPKMTWIGSQLLRFPFILKTSLPHELLHSWWGASVFVDYEKGNWCEGLTSFGADYGLLNQEEKKLYRIKALTSYLNYVNQSQELSLSQFTSRGEDRSLQALGYDKSVMVFVMLEQLVGPQNFAAALKKFYKNFKFKRASWDDFFAIQSEVSGQDLQSFKKFWVQQPGFVAKDFLKLKKTNQEIQASAKPSELAKLAGFQIQTQLFSQSGNKKLVLDVLPSGKNLVQSQFAIQENYLTYSIDPDFYLFRDLNLFEKPINFSEFFGAKKVEYQINQSDWVQAFKNQFTDKQWMNVKSDLDFDKASVYLVDLISAEKNSEIKKLMAEKGIKITANEVQIENRKFDLSVQAVFLTLRIKNSTVVVMNLNPNLPLARWLQRWSRYGGQSYVVLNNSSAELQGVWVDALKSNL